MLNTTSYETVPSSSQPLHMRAYDVEVFFDGGCPLCLREINMLRRWDKAGRIRFTDIDSPDFNPQSVEKTYDELMSQIYGRLPDGSLIRGVEVFRRLYSAVGFKSIVAFSRWPGVRQILDAGYYIFAKNRLRLTGRCNAGGCKVNS